MRPIIMYHGAMSTSPPSAEETAPTGYDSIMYVRWRWRYQGSMVRVGVYMGNRDNYMRVGGP